MSDDGLAFTSDGVYFTDETATGTTRRLAFSSQEPPT